MNIGKFPSHVNSLSHFASSYFEEINRCVQALDKGQIEKAGNMILEAYRNEKNIFIFGNGGSASTASHFVCDLAKGTRENTYHAQEKRFRVIPLADNTATMTAYANDFSYDDVFIEQLKNLLQKGDLVFVLSGSGNSKNVIKAVAYAKDYGAKCIGLLGNKTGGVLNGLVDCSIIVDSTHYGPIEDIHLLVTHILGTWVFKEIHKNLT